MRRVPSSIRRPGLGALAVAVWPFLLSGCNQPGGAPTAPSSPPSTGAIATRDVLLVTIDTLRADALGFAGHPHAETPVLDRLAASGRVFEQAHAHNVVTLPSHANMLSGRYPFDHGIRDNTGFVLPEDVPTAATLLADAGFATAAFVAAFPLDARYGLARGFEIYDDQLPSAAGRVRFRSTERPGNVVVERATRWWQDHADRRRFLWVHLFEPHAPYEPPPDLAARFADDLYAGEVAAADRYLGPLLEPLLDAAADVLVIVTSDHGESLGEHGEATHGLFAYEATLKVPLVIWAPGLNPARITTPARHIDLLPTMLDAAGQPVPAGLPGRSLLGDREAPDTMTTYFEALSANLDRGWAPLRGVIEQREKMIDLPLVELYDLALDPDELDNRANRARRRVASLRERLPEESVWPPARTAPSSDEEVATLRSLGYASSSAAAKQRYGPEDDPKRLVGVDQEVRRFIGLFEQRALEEATAVARKVVADQPRMALARENLAQVLLERGRRDEAIEAMEQAVADGAAGPPLVRQLALSLLEGGNVGRALELMAPLEASRDPDDRNTLGVVLATAGQLDAARRVLSSVFTIDPTNPEAHQHLALVALRGEAWVDAADAAQRAIDGNEHLHHAWNYLGVARVNLGQPREAIAAWRQASALAPDDVDLIFNIAMVAMRIDDRDEARRALEAFVARAPADRYGPDIERARAQLRAWSGTP